MPTVLRVGASRYFFYSNEGTEPPHIHVQEGKRLAKFWLEPVSLSWSTGFRGHELSEIERTVSEQKEKLKEAWDEFFSA